MAASPVCAPVAGCRCCGSAALEPVLDLGAMPPSDAFAASAEAPDPAYPLEVAVCAGCGLAQLRHTVAPEALFSADYHYHSSYTATVVENAARAVAAALARAAPPPGALAVELASNDGYLLRHARAAGLAVLGVDPAPGPVAAARAAGIETVQDFFGEALAARLAAEGRRAHLVFANNVLAHVADTAGFVRGIARLLHPEGVASVEVPYLRDLVDHVEFDTVYHEHLCYFSATALAELFRRNGLVLADLERIPIHGGSLRLFVRHAGAEPSAAVRALLAEEAASGLATAAAFRAFAARVAGVGEALRGLLAGLRAQGLRVAAYGAAAKGTILLNHFGIGPAELLWVADRNPHKHGLFVPGVKLPIVGPERIEEDRPDALLVLPWNHRDEIMRQLQPFADRGGRFIIPIPEPRIV